MSLNDRQKLKIAIEALKKITHCTLANSAKCTALKALEQIEEKKQ